MRRRMVIVQPRRVHSDERALRYGDGALLAGSVRRRERRVLRALLRDGDRGREEAEGFVEDAAVDVRVSIAIRERVEGGRGGVGT